jgi:outer membrane immunogenic protein
MDSRKLAPTLAFALAASFASFTALADSGVYIGGGIGTAKIEDNAGNPGAIADFSETDTAWKGFVGYNFDVIPLVKFAAEVGYRDLGKPSASVAGVPIEYSVKGLDYGVLAGVGLGPVDLFARVGGMQYDLKKSTGGVNNEYDGTAPVYGIGLWFTIAGIGFRADYDKVDIDELENAEMVTISAFYKF